jgi:two-component system response regulator VicR
MNKILIVEDDIKIQDILAYNLEKESFKVFTADSGDEALEILHEEDDITLVLMDAMMPRMNGFDCTRVIRGFSNVPIIMLTALSDEDSVLQGFECGVDDYIRKPFSIREVVARVNANIRRPEMGLLKSQKSVIQINDLVVNTATNKVNIGNKEKELTDIEYKLLMFFYNNPNVVFDRETLLKEVWGTSYADARTVDVNIRRLREKIEKVDSDPQNIRTRRGKGYYLDLK